MNIVVASSRGFGLKELLPSGTVVDVNPGGTLQDLRERAKELVPHKVPHKAHVYYLGGVPDLTVKANRPKNVHSRYREYIFSGEVEPVVKRYKAELIQCQKSTLKDGAIPIFVTIPKYNIKINNNSLLQKGKTNILLHTHRYDDMQTLLESAIEEINTFIFSINRNINVSTPFIHTSIMKRRGRAGHGYHIYCWDLFTDGLHPKESLCKKWATSFEVAFKKNRANDEEDETLSPKRSWRRERRFQPLA